MIYFRVLANGFKLQHSRELKQWLQQVAELHEQRVGELCYVFMDDEQLLEMNRQHLKHDVYTDILTFDYRERPTHVQGDVFISVDRVNDNAAMFKSHPVDELHRVMVHGLLHLLGYTDKTKAEQQQMRKAEDRALATRMF